MRPTHILALAFGTLSALAAQAQTAASPAPDAQLTREAPVLDRHTQRVEHITTEDAGNRVDEVRAGGETKRITVQPKSAAPAYEVLPSNGPAAPREAAPGGTGPRVWKIPF